MARKQLPPKFISVIYSVFGMVALILFYFGIIYGIRFTSAMEGAWAFAFIVALVQEFFIHQLVSCGRPRFCSCFASAFTLRQK
jgi:hypothetical protein